MLSDWETYLIRKIRTGVGVKKLVKKKGKNVYREVEGLEFMGRHSWISKGKRLKG